MQLAIKLSAFVSLIALPGLALAAPTVSFCADAQKALLARPAAPIAFLSDSDSAYAYLEARQELAFEDNPSVRRWTGNAEDEAAIREVITALDQRVGSEAGGYAAIYGHILAQLQQAMPTRFEDPRSIYILCSVGLAVHAEIAREIPGFVMPYLGTLPSGTLNARALSVPGSPAELVTVNFSLFTFVHELGKIGLGTIRIEEKGDQVVIDLSDSYFDAIRSDPEFLVRFSKALEDFANQRLIRGHAPPRALDDPLLQVMNAALEEFVIAHEFAHLVLGHTRRDLGPAGDFGETQPLSDAVLRQRWGEEVVADLYAAALVQRISMARNRAAPTDSLESELGEFVRYAPVLFFQLNQIAEEARYVHDQTKAPPEFTGDDRAAVLGFLGEAAEAQGSSLGGEPIASVTALPVPAIVRQFGDHPPSWARRALVAAYWRSQTPKPKSDTEIALGMVAITMGNNLEQMWSDMAPIWVRIAQQERGQ